MVKFLKSGQDKTQGYYDVPPLEPGDRVRVRPGRDKQWRQAEVLPRSYVVKDQQGTVFRRNRRQIIATPQDQPMQLYSKPPPLTSMSSASPPTKAEPSVISGLTTQPNITSLGSCVKSGKSGSSIVPCKNLIYLQKFFVLFSFYKLVS